MTGSRPLASHARGQRGDLEARLADAAEIEHGLLLQYLFAAFAIKQRTDEGLTPLEFDRVRIWKRVILEVAREEMAHLATVCNLQLAIGAEPHLRPPELPVVNRYFGPRAPFRLAALSPETIERFVWFERPEGDGAGPTVATLYRAIQRDLAELDADGELFVSRGHPEDVDLWGISGQVRFGRITDVASGVRAIDAVIEQGEGEAVGEASHYARFRRVARELAAAEELNPSRPVTADPAACDDPRAIVVGHAFASVYGALLAVLTRYYEAVAHGRAEVVALRRLSRPLMSLLLRPLGELLTDLPAGPAAPGRNAAPVFAPLSIDAVELGAVLRREADALAALHEPRAGRIAENLRLTAREADALA